jgi:hypothetical protein
MLHFHGNGNYLDNPTLKRVFYQTKIFRKPVSGIVSGYHELPYILVTPAQEDGKKSVEINARIFVSPKFLITPDTLGESFEEVFDPDTFDEDLQGRVFSFTYGKKRNISIKNQGLRISDIDREPGDHIESLYENLSQKENITTSLLYGPDFTYYPISVDRLINDILDREFRD